MISNDQSIHAAIADPQAVLEMHDPEGGEWLFPLEAHQLTIGRAVEASIRLQSPTVSRHHALLTRDPFSRWWLQDLGSRNGVRLNGRAVGRTMLHPGDTFEIGRFTLSLHAYPSSATPMPPPAPGDEASAPSTEPQSPPPAPSEQQQEQSLSSLSELAAPQVDTANLATLTEFSQRLMNAEEESERLRLLCRLMVRHDFNGRCAAVVRVHRSAPTKQPQVLGQPQSSVGAGERMPHFSPKILRGICQSNMGVLVEDIFAESPSEDLWSERPPLSAVASPLRSDSRTIDALYVTFPAEYGTGEWLALVSLVVQQFRQAEQALLVREQARANAALEHELTRASQIQRRLVPSAPDVPGLELSIGFQPCRWVGGDYTDVVPMPDGRVALVIADVSGKGLPAALITSSLHSMVHGGLEAGTELSRVIHALNNHLCRYLDDRSFVTLAAVAMDPSTGQIECLNAGHLPPLIFSSDGGMRRLPNAQNLPLGVQSSSAPLSTSAHRIQPDELLAMYTDGLTELPDHQDRMLGLERLGGILRDLYPYDSSAAPRKVESVASRLNQTLDKYLGDRLPHDDRTFLLARRNGQGR